MAHHREKPLMLKDFLELDANSDSCSGFQCIPRRARAHNASTGTVRYLLDVEPCGGSGGLIRSRSDGAFTKISAFVKSVKNLHLSSPNRTNKTFLPRSFSKKLMSGSFWKRREKESEAEKVRVKDIVRLKSFELYGERRSLYFPSPILSRSCSESEGSSSSTDSVLSSNGSFDCSATGENPRDSLLESPKRNIVDDNENKKEEEECRGCQSEEEKEQLSPVSVMDFPSSSPPYFQQSLANIDRTKHEMLQKIRLFQGLAELDPIDLTESFANVDDHVASDEEGTAWDSDLIQRLRSDGYLVGPHKKLLSDFYAEGLTWNADMEERLTSAAEDWIRGHSHLAVAEHGEAQMKDMERNRQWKCFEEEKEEVATDVEVEVLGLLVEELVLDFLQPLSFQ